MKFIYTMQEHELSQALTLLGTPIMGAWLVYLVVAVTMFPSIVLFIAIGAESSFGWFTLMAIAILIAAVWAYIQRKGYPPTFQESMEFTEDQLSYGFGHSRVDCRWSVIDSVENRDDGLVIYCYGRPWLLPKRVVGERERECLDLLQRIRSASRDETGLPPIEIYQTQILDNPSPGYQYQITAEDLSQALHENFKPVVLDPLALDGTSRSKSSPMATWIILVLLAVLVWQIVYFSSSASFVLPSTSMVTWAITVAGWFLPVVWLAIWRKWSWLFRLRPVTQKVPKLASTLKLNSTGWVIANPLSGTLGDWRDLQIIYQGERFFGLKMINQLAYLIPKRIFASPQEADEFLRHVGELSRSQRMNRSEFDSAEPVPIRETRNPYQPPLS